jgi:hypothetical protein
MLNELSYKHRALILGFLSQIVRLIQSADEKELDDYDQFIRYFYQAIHEPEKIEIPQNFSEIAKQQFGVEIDVETLKMAFKKIASNPQIMVILGEVVQAFDQAREN